MVLLLAFGSYLVHRGLEDADRIASVVGVFLNVFALILTAGGVWLGWKAGRSTPEPEPGALVSRLAGEIRRQLIREEAVRRVHDPFPLAVRLDRAEDWLQDHEENVGAAPEALDGTLDTIIELYHRVPSGRVVVLGRAGAGKSVLAMRLVLGLLDDRSGPDDPVPVLVPMSSWDPREKPLDAWLSEQILATYPFLEPLGDGAALFEDGRLLPVLDGFDELGETTRTTALKMINYAFSPGRRIIMTSRVDEYAAAVSEGDVLTGSVALRMQDLDFAEVTRYLPLTARKPSDPGAGGKWRATLAGLAADPASPLRETLSTPLMVSMARAAYSETAADPGELLNREMFPDSESIQVHLLDGFVAAAYDQPWQPGEPRVEDPGRALRFLASEVYDLYGDAINWWHFSKAVPRYGAAAIGGVLGAAIGALVTFPRDRTSSLFAVGFLGVTGSIGVLLGSDTIEPRRASTSVRSVLRSTLSHARYAIPVALGIGVAMGAATASLADYAVMMLILGAGMSLAAGVGETRSRSESGQTPRSLLAADRRVAVLAIILLGTVFFLSRWDRGIGEATLFGALGAILAAILYAWPAFVVARIWFFLSGSFPWRVIGFLEHAHRRGVLRQVGGSYQFRHALLKDRLVMRALEGRSPPRWADVVIADRRRPALWYWLKLPFLYINRLLLPEGKAQANDVLAICWSDLGRYSRAVICAEAAAAIGDPDLRENGVLQTNLGLRYGEAGRLDDAYETLKAVTHERWRRFGTGDPHALSTRLNFAALLVDVGRIAEAEPIVDGLVKAYTRLLPPSDGQVISARSVVLRWRLLRGDDDAESALREWIDALSRDGRLASIGTETALAMHCARTGRLPEAEHLLTALIRSYRPWAGRPARLERLILRLQRLRVRQELGEQDLLAEAERIARRLDRWLGPGHPDPRAAAAFAASLVPATDGAALVADR
ncbi:hypothetical protein ACTI_63520 [Actinoplanes sp. OR16]|nr:hypothetical protein ACTI_63520 [Actinoplanes sp. OR16]